MGDAQHWLELLAQNAPGVLLLFLAFRKRLTALEDAVDKLTRRINRLCRLSDPAPKPGPNGHDPSPARGDDDTARHRR